MKIIGLFFVCLLQMQLAFAQFEKGKMAVGLNLNLQFRNNDTDPAKFPKNIYYAIGDNLSGELFLGKNFSLIVGFASRFSSAQTIQNRTNINGQEYTLESSINTQDLAPYIGVKKYWLNKDGTFGLFVLPHSMLNYSVSKYKRIIHDPLIPPQNQLQENFDETWQVEVNADLGFCYFFNSKLSLEISTTLFQGTLLKNQQQFYLDSNFGRIAYGMRYYFN